MTTIIKEVYEAFKEVGATDEKAMNIAGTIYKEVTARDVDIHEIRSDLKLLKWIGGVLVIAVLIPILKSYGVIP